MIHAIALIGVGGIGFRHFQSLVTLTMDGIQLFLVDLNAEALNRARAYVTEVGAEKCPPVTCCSSVSELPTNLDVAIVATSSSARRIIVEKLLTHANVKYMVLEKFLFPTMEDYDVVEQLLASHDTTAFVNCPRRMQDIYNTLRNEVIKASFIRAVVSGCNWGLACNAIHFLDALAFLTGGAGSLNCTGALLSPSLLKSKREGYLEFCGKLAGNLGQNIQFVLDCRDEPGQNITQEILLFVDDLLYQIDEMAGILTVCNLATGETQREEKFTTRFQSQLTSYFVKNLLTTGTCQLTTYSESCGLHKPFLQTLLNHLDLVTGEMHTKCLIT